MVVCEAGVDRIGRSELGHVMHKKVLAGAAAALTMALLSASAAHAAIITTCTGAAGGILASPAAIACTTASGNTLNTAHDANTSAALASLGLTWDGTFFDHVQNLNNATTITLATPISGITFFGIHFGNSSPVGNSTVFYKVDAAPGTKLIQLNTGTKGSSDFEVFTTGGVPEPATWGTMIVGLGMTGAAIRASRRQAKLA